MPKVEQNMWEAYHWIPKCTGNSSGDWVGGQTIYLVMNNASGLGTDQFVNEDNNILADDFKINILQKVPRFPQKSVLDLGACMFL